jgi:hypothetical protein
MVVQNQTESVEQPKAGSKEWIGLAVLALACVLYAMDLTVLHLDPPGRVVRVIRAEPAHPGSTVRLTGHEVRLLEDTAVLQHPGERDVEGFRQLADRGGPARKVHEDVAAGGVGERREGAIEGVILNHSVYYRRAERRGQPER